MAITEYMLIVFILITGLAQVLCTDDGIIRLTPNVAAKGNATQSSRYKPLQYYAYLGNDGKFSTNVLDCAVTSDTPPSWWQVDLLAVYEIRKVALTVASQYQENVKDFYIDVSNHSDGSSAQQCAHEPNSFNAGETRVYSCPCEIYGKYVRIRYDLNARNHMELCEVQVQPGGGFCAEPKVIANAVRSVPDSQYKVGTTITYTCNKCYTGGGTSTCGCSREWSIVPQCSVNYCADPGTIENGQTEGSSPYTCISTVKYTCNEGYWLLGPEILNCGIDGQWDYGKPVCIESSQGCGEPPKIDHAQRFGSLMEVKYRCNECYTGGGSAICRDGRWDFDAQCEITLCDDIPFVRNGNKSPDKDSAACGEKITYTCNQGFTLVGDKELECLANGLFSGKVPMCNNSGTKEPDSESNSERNEEDDNDAVVLAVAVIGSLLGGILVTLVVVYLVLKRRGIELCQRKPEGDKKELNQDYEKTKAPMDSAKTDDDVNDQYMELEDPKFAGYMNQVPN